MKHVISSVHLQECLHVHVLHKSAMDFLLTDGAAENVVYNHSKTIITAQVHSIFKSLDCGKYEGKMLW
jgi:hypothetical protein